MKAFSRHWFTAFAWAVGLMSAVAALTPVKITPLGSVVALITSMLAATFWAHRNSQQKSHLPVEQVAPLKLSRLQWPCDTNLAHQANGLAKRFYGAENIPFERYEQWRAKNAEILVCVTDDRNEVVGFFDILPLKHSPMDMFVQGSLVESSFSHEDVCAPAVAAQCDRLYLAGIAVKDPERHADMRNASILVWAMVKYLQHFYARDDKERELFALASTPEGEDLIGRFKFSIARPADGRQDHHNLYKFSFSKTSLEDVLAHIPDWGKAVSLPWEARPIGVAAPRSVVRPRRPMRGRGRPGLMEKD